MEHTKKTKHAEISDETQPGFASGDLKLSAQRDLAAGVLKQATQDLRRHNAAGNKVERELYFDAYRWMTVNECSSPFSFLNVCQLLNLPPDSTRHELLGDSSLGALSYLARRCGRAAGRLRTSFSQLFLNERNGHADPEDMAFHNAPSAVGGYLHETAN